MAIVTPPGTRSSPFAADASGQLDVLGHDGHAFRVDGAQVGIFEKTDKVRLAGFLQGHHGRTLETQVGLEVLGYLSHQTLERQLADEELGAFLIATDLAQRDGSWPVAMRLLDAAGGRGALASGLRGELFPRCLATGRLASGLLSTSHR